MAASLAGLPLKGLGRSLTSSRAGFAGFFAGLLPTSAACTEPAKSALEQCGPQSTADMVTSAPQLAQRLEQCQLQSTGNYDEAHLSNGCLARVAL